MALYEETSTHLAGPLFEDDHNLNVWKEPNSVIGPWHPTGMDLAIQPESVVVPASSEHSSTTPEALKRATTMESLENPAQITYSCTDCSKIFCKRHELKYAHTPSSSTFPF